MADLTIDCPPTYPQGCKIVFVGEGPGLEEAKAGEGWVGPAGRCLQKAARVAGLDWSTIGKSNVTKCYKHKVPFKEAFYETIQEPIYTKTGKLSKKTRKRVTPTDEYNEWVVALEREIQSQSPNLVVACGNEALTAITQYSGITSYRGSILESPWGREGNGYSFKVLAVEHPSYIIHGQLLDFWILAYDLKKAKREMEFPEIRREAWLSSPETGMEAILFHLATLRKAPSKLWTLDIETRAGTMACFAISYYTDSGMPIAFCVPIQRTSGPYWTPVQEVEIWKALRETAKANPNLCNQNIVYDINYLLDYNIEPSGVYMDTMLAHTLLYPEFPKGLDFLCSFYLDDAVYYKWMGTNEVTKATKDVELWERCCLDAVYTRRIVDKIDKELQRKDLWNFYHGK